MNAGPIQVLEKSCSTHSAFGSPQRQSTRISKCNPPAAQKCYSAGSIVIRPLPEHCRAGLSKGLHTRGKPLTSLSFLATQGDIFETSLSKEESERSSASSS